MVSEMTSLERVLTALRGGEPDRIPSFEWLIDRRVIQALYPGDDLFDFVEHAELDAVVIYADSRKEWLSDSSYIDEWGITWTVTTEEYPIGTGYPLQNAQDLAGLRIPDPCADWRFDTLRRAVERFKGKKAILFRLRDAYSLPRYLRGFALPG